MTEPHTPLHSLGEPEQASPSIAPGTVGADDPPRLVRHAGERVPAEFLDSAVLAYVPTSDGARLRTAYWSAIAAPARGTVMVLSGFSEFIEKYYETAYDLRELGFAVLCFDWRGQGLSTRAQQQRRGWVPNYEIMMHDVLELVSYRETLNAPDPLVALGHSMGGNLCLRLLQTHGNLFAAAAVTAPMLGLKGIPTWLLRSITHTGSRVGMDERYAPGAKDNNPFGPHIPLSTDPTRIETWRTYLRTEPYLITHGATWRWVREAATSMHLVNQPANIARIKTPVLIVNAMLDSLVDPLPTQKFAAQCATAQSLELTDAQHEVLQEVDGIRNRFFAAFDDFLHRSLNPN